MPKIQHVKHVGDRYVPVEEMHQEDGANNKCITESVNYRATGHGPSEGLQPPLGKPDAI